MKYLFLIIMIYLESGLCFCQVAKYWYFGNYAGLEFNQQKPSPLINSGMLSYDGSAVLTDCAGQLIAYTNGEELYDSFGKVAINGSNLAGSTNCMHPALIIKAPLIDSLGYIITCDDIGGNNGIKYSEFSISNRKLTVIRKNISLYQRVTEKIVLIRKANGIDYWLIGHELGTNNYIIFSIDKTGIRLQSIQSIGTIHTYGSPFGDGAQGQITSNMEGTMIAVALYSENKVELFQFDRSTGVLSSPLTINSLFRAWGVEFSPNGHLLYVTRWTANELLQYDLTNYSQTNVQNSKSVVGRVNGIDPTYTIGTLSIGPDSKIYVAVWESPYLGVIHNPDNQGSLCNFTEEGVYLAGRRSTAGLPYFVKPYINNDVIGNRIIDTLLCDSIIFLETDLVNPVWSSGQITNNIAVNKPGTYTVFGQRGCLNFSDTFYVKSLQTPIDFLGNNKTLCIGETDTLILNKNVLWFDSIESDRIIISNQKFLWATMNTKCGKIIDTITIEWVPKPTAPLPLRDTIYCHNKLPFVLNIEKAHWSNGNYEQLVVYKGGKYSYNINEHCYMVQDSFFLSLLDEPFKLSNDTILCLGDTLKLNCGDSLALWSDGTIGAIKNVFQSGNFSYKIINSCGTFVDEINVSFNKIIDTLINSNSYDTFICGDKNLNLITKYKFPVWSTGDTGKTLSVSSPGTYWVLSEQDCSLYIDTFYVHKNNFEEDFLGPDLVKCKGTIDTIWSNNVLCWFGIVKSKYYVITNQEIVWANIETSCGIMSDTLHINWVEVQEPPMLSTDTTFCVHEIPFKLSLPKANWSTGEYEDLIVVKSGTYYYTITDECVHHSDSIIINIDKPPTPLPLDTVLCEGEKLLLTSGNQNTIWSNGTRTDQLIVDKSGSYYFILENACGLFKSTIQVEFENSITYDYIPNIFSPNGDQINDLFPGNQFILPYSLKIYSRWGELLFESTNKSWDGQFNGKQMQNGVYVFLLETTACRNKKLIKGSITLVR